MKKMPALFIGHGSPMNAIENNQFTDTWKNLARNIPKPKIIICISAHWETNGSYITSNADLETIHDFGGFPTALSNYIYPAKGNPDLARKITNTISNISLSDQWGLDHGSWSILCHMYPNADIPVLQLSLNRNLSITQHYEFAKQLAYLRDEGILFIASGNIVHNLSQIKWSRDNTKENSFHWATEFNTKIINAIINNDIDTIVNYKELSSDANLSVPTLDHFIPLLYTLAIKSETESIRIFNDSIIMGSLSMTSIQIG